MLNAIKMGSGLSCVQHYSSFVEEVWGGMAKWQRQHIYRCEVKIPDFFFSGKKTIKCLPFCVYQKRFDHFWGLELGC